MFIHTEDISHKVINRLNTVNIQSNWEELSLPVENKYIPRNFKMASICDNSTVFFKLTKIIHHHSSQDLQDSQDTDS